jgi:hypothetical protein
VREEGDTPPTPTPLYTAGQIIKDDVNGLSSSSDI